MDFGAVANEIMNDKLALLEKLGADAPGLIIALGDLRDLTGGAFRFSMPFKCRPITCGHNGDYNYATTVVGINTTLSDYRKNNLQERGNHKLSIVVAGGALTKEILLTSLTGDYSDSRFQPIYLKPADCNPEGIENLIANLITRCFEQDLIAPDKALGLTQRIRAPALES